MDLTQSCEWNVNVTSTIKNPINLQSNAIYNLGLTRTALIWTTPCADVALCYCTALKKRVNDSTSGALLNWTLPIYSYDSVAHKCSLGPLRRYTFNNMRTNCEIHTSIFKFIHIT